MANDWRAYCRDPRFTLEAVAAVVHFESGRTHRVRVTDEGESFRLSADVAGAAAVRDIPNLPVRLWQINRTVQLVSFRRDERGRVRAEGWLPKAGLTEEEFRLVLHRVAAEADRLEYLLTGRDIE